MGMINPHILQLMQREHVPVSIAVRLLHGESLSLLRPQSPNKWQRWEKRFRQDLKTVQSHNNGRKKRKGFVNRVAGECQLDKDLVAKILFTDLSAEDMRNAAMDDLLVEQMGQPSPKKWFEWAESLLLSYADAIQRNTDDFHQLVMTTSQMLAQEYQAIAKVVAAEARQSQNALPVSGELPKTGDQQLQGGEALRVEALRAEAERRLSTVTDSVCARAVHEQAVMRVKNLTRRFFDRSQVRPAWIQHHGLEKRTQWELEGLVREQLWHMRSDQRFVFALREAVKAECAWSDVQIIAMPDNDLRALITDIVERRLDAIAPELCRKAHALEQRHRKTQERQQVDQHIEHALRQQYAHHARIDPLYFKSCLTKANIAAFLELDAATSRRNRLWPLLQMLCERLDENDIAWQRFCQTYQRALALSPVEVEQRLSITRSERYRWTKAEKLTVAYTESLRKYGRQLSVPFYDYLGITGITAKQLAQWRKDHQQQVAKAAKNRLQKAAQTRRKQADLRKKVQAAITERLHVWAAHSNLYAVATLEVAMWTVWASRWAKYNQLKEQRALIHAARYNDAAEAWYALKNQAMGLLAATPYACLFAYVPEHPHRSSFDLCDHHLGEFREERHLMRGMDYNARDYFDDHVHEIQKCQRCTVRTHRHYYSLYYLEVQVDGIEDQFSFHVPYDIGEAFLADFQTLPRAQNHEEGWSGGFRFGREISDDEAIAFPEKTVREQLAAAIQKLQLFVPCEKSA